MIIHIFVSNVMLCNVNDTIFWLNITDRVHFQLSVYLMWHMPAHTSETAAILHSALGSTIQFNTALSAKYTAFISRSSGTQFTIS